ncbi:Bug family tripartite tricarboxylate transporter substrate binding protein [Bordetella genomosp. 6]|uniref:Bug family tripartite tricarboxylate transporter substrate binding protein n=1 Tax=Bordetella genomosp. 6 TaxID=463024 RepID=UPI000A28D6DC|nr:tripartite tricarboxylate transporter substrate binding protein [Bordetella genomosp. 6]ARP75696.1 LacI family transcriptional regulator [Bordetella genomosp. 6]
MLLHRVLISLATGVLTLGGLGAAHADAYPTKPIRLVVPYPPGGITDIAARGLARAMSEELKQSVIVENRAGAGGIIGSDHVARAPADGYTLLIGTSATHGTNPSTYANLPYSATDSFEPIAAVASSPLLVVVNPSSPVRDVQGLIAHLKANPGKESFASTGTGGSLHLTLELFKLMTGTDIQHVPYKGSAPALTDLIGGHIQLMFDNMPSSLPQVKAGSLRALAVTGPQRSALVPELPTVAEAVPGFSSASWVALYAPRNTPAAIVQTLNAAANKGLKSQDVLTQFSAAGLEPTGGTPAELDSFMRAEIAKWAEVVKKIDLPPSKL